MFIYALFFGLSLYALKYEYNEGTDSFKTTKPDPNDSVRKSILKLQRCIGYETRAVVWRRIFLSSVLTVLLLYYLTFNALPTEKQFFLGFIVAYTVYYANWKLYTAQISSVANRWCNNHIKKIKIS